MATQPSEEQGNPNQAELEADIENVCVSVGSAPSQSRGAPKNSEKEVDGPYYRPLLRAALRGDWESAKRFFEQDDASKTSKITSRSETLLHIAALSAKDQFLENLVKILPQKALEEVDCDGRTALHNAVLCGRIRMVKALVKNNPKLTQLEDNVGCVPLKISAVEASMHKEIAWFLAKNTSDDKQGHFFSSPSAIDIIMDLTMAGHFDITVYLVRQYPQLIDKSINEHAEPLDILNELAKNNSHFPSGTRLSVLEALIYKCIPVGLNNEPTNKNSDPVIQCLTKSLWKATTIIVPTIKRIHEMKRRHVAAIELAKQILHVISHGKTTDFLQKKELLFHATVWGITEIVKLCIQFFPELIWIRSGWNNLAFEAVSYRQVGTLRLFLMVSSTNKLSLVFGPSIEDSRSMMSAAAQNRVTEYCPNVNAATNVAGVAFQMQREVQWYKAVESWVITSEATVYRENDKSHWIKFVENHKELAEKAEKWMKDTANSCMLVSTLIATVLFAAAFTMPGGNDDKTGMPLLLGWDSFLVFTISDALGLFCSVTAILLFLAILTSRYEAQDFLYSLPQKIIMGLSLLFLSMAFMLVAFTAALTMVIDKRLEWALITFTLLASVPMTLFVVLQLPLLFQMVKSTYGPSIFRPEAIWTKSNILNNIGD